MMTGTAAAAAASAKASYHDWSRAKKETAAFPLK